MHSNSESPKLTLPTLTCCLFFAAFWLGCDQNNEPSQANDDAQVSRSEPAEAKGDLRGELESLKQQAAGLSAKPKNNDAQNPNLQYELIASKALTIAEASRQEELAFESLQFVVSILRFGDHFDAALTELSRNHANDKRIGDICMVQSLNTGPAIESFLKSIVAKSTNREIKAKATYSLSRFYNFTRMTQKQWEVGGQQVEEFKKAMPVELKSFIERFVFDEKETRSLLNDLVENYADIKVDNKSMKDVADDAIRYLESQAKN